MLLHRLLPYVFITIVAGAANLTLILSELPACSVSCIVTGLSSSPAAISDPRSACTNNTLQASLSACIQTKCNSIDQTQVATVNKELCKGIPVESRAWPLAIVALVCIPVSLIAVALRCYSRLAISRQIGYDDFIIIVAAVFLIALGVLDLYNGFINGYGQHTWTLDPLKLPELLKIFYVAEILYSVVINLVKISILLFYLRIFPGFWFRVANFATIAAIASSGLTITLVTIFQCNPIAGAWDRTIPSKCVDLNMTAYASSGLGIGFDFIIIFLPIPNCLKLHMNAKKRLNVVIMFSVGSLACIITIIRLKYIVAFGNSPDPTWDNIIPAGWSLAEICIATLCASLPAIRAILCRYFPSIFDINTPDQSYYTDPSKPPSTSNSQRGPSGYTEKVGPSYNKRVITNPDDKFLNSLDTPLGSPEAKDVEAWNNSRNHNIDQRLASSEEVCHDASSSDYSFFALEGPRESDDEADEVGTFHNSTSIGVALSDFRASPLWRRMERERLESEASGVELSVDERERAFAEYKWLESLKLGRGRETPDGWI